MPRIAVATFDIINEKGFQLPSKHAPSTSIDVDHTIKFNMPSNTRESGTFSFTIDALSDGWHLGVDVAYQLSVNGKTHQKWVHQTALYCGVTIPVFGLKPGQENRITITMTKGGAWRPPVHGDDPGPVENLGGKGVVDFANFILTVHKEYDV